MHFKEVLQVTALEYKRPKKHEIKHLKFESGDKCNTFQLCVLPPRYNARSRLELFHVQSAELQFMCSATHAPR